MRRDLSLAARQQADIIVFPEQFITGYFEHYAASRLKDVFSEVSNHYPDMLIIFGTISEDGMNKQYAYTAGTELCVYEKVHLFRPNGEYDFWQPGGEYVCFEHRQQLIGLGTCNDVRFPEQTRSLRINHGIQYMVFPALWPYQRDHIWRALLQARSIENGIFTIGCCVSGVDNGSQRFDGAGNYVFDPHGNPVYPQDRLYSIDPCGAESLLVDPLREYRGGLPTRLCTRGS